MTRRCPQTTSDSPGPPDPADLAGRPGTEGPPEPPGQRGPKEHGSDEHRRAPPAPRRAVERLGCALLALGVAGCAARMSEHGALPPAATDPHVEIAQLEEGIAARRAALGLPLRQHDGAAAATGDLER